MDPLQEIQLGLVLLVGFQHFPGLVDAAVQHLNVRENQLHVDGLNVPLGVDAALHMDDVVVFKAAHHVDDGVHLPDVGEELVAQALALGSALHQARDVHKLNGGGGELLRLVHFGQLVQALVRHGHHAHVGLDGAEGVVGRLGAGVGDGVKQGALAHVGKAHDS